MASPGKNNSEPELYYGTFPSGFKWGTATSAYQIEGGWNIDGKGENIWDRFCHEEPKRIKDLSNGDTACDSYHKVLEDVKALKQLGAKIYRFSISWPRLLPNGTYLKVNEAGIEYYNTLINALKAEGIEPMITLYHWDLPQNIQEMGGWENEEIVTLFAEYARLCYKSFGDRVKYWVTINEPYVFALHGYDYGEHAPGVKEPSHTPYKVMHTALKAHAAAYNVYKEGFQAVQKGQVGIAADSRWYEPADPTNPEDVAAAERLMQFRLGWVLGPIFTGQYPKVMREFIDKAGQLPTGSRLPSFDEKWSERIKGTADFVGLNHYTSQMVKYGESKETHLGWDHDAHAIKYDDESWPKSSCKWLRIVPWGFRKLLNWIREAYGNPLVIVTENGTSDNQGLKDTIRQYYFKYYINEMLKAVDIDKCNVIGYTAWSLMDNFEWSHGYTEKFGLFAIQPDTLERVPKDSVKLLRDIFKNNGFVKSN